MAVEIKETTGNMVENAVGNVVMGVDLVSGTAATVAENITRAVAHPTREAHKVERRGAAVNKRIGRDLTSLAGNTAEAIDAVMPEKVALLGIHAIKDRARRKDLLGDFAYRTLEFLNGGLETVLVTLNRLERATQPPTRPGTTHTRPSRPIRKATGSARRKAGRAAVSTTKTVRSTARRGTARARRTEKKSS